MRGKGEASKARGKVMEKEGERFEGEDRLAGKKWRTEISGKLKCGRKREKGKTEDKSTMTEQSWSKK